MEAPKLLIIEDNLAIRRFLRTAILSQGYQYDEASTGNAGMQKVIETKPTIILLDLGLPDIDGIEIIKQIRLWTAIPIIILSARDQVDDKVKALDMGANDYLTKPFSISELHARIRVALRHSEFVEANETPLFEAEHLKIDLINRHVYVHDQRINLSPTQFAILAVLVRQQNKIVTHKQLLKEVWGENSKENIDYLRIYMHQLRHKLEVNPSFPKLLLTEPGIGYRLHYHHD